MPEVKTVSVQLPEGMTPESFAKSIAIGRPTRPEPNTNTFIQLSKYLKGIRNKVTLATKFGLDPESPTAGKNDNSQFFRCFY